MNFYSIYIISLNNHINIDQTYILELWSEADQALLSPRKTAHWDTRSDPLSSAGTAWAFYWYDQYLHATGPLTEPVVIKVNIPWFPYMGLDATKPVFGVSDKASFKPVSSTTESI